VNVKVNKATDTDGVVGTVPGKLDWDSLTTSGMTLASLAVDSAQDLHADGTVALNALSGVLVASGAFILDLGQVSTAAPNNGVSFTNASAVSLTLNGATVFVGTGGSLSAASSTANVVNGNLGFRGAVGSLKIVSIKDTNNGSASATDDKSYLGVQITGLSADLIGLETILVFHAGNVNVAVNKATDTDNDGATVPAKLDWDSLTTTGMTLENLVIDSTLDVHADGSVAMNALSGVLVASGSFALDLGQVSTAVANNGVSFTNASAVSLTLTGATVFVGTGGSLSNATSGASVVNGTLGFRGSVGSLQVVSIKDTNNGSVSTTDDKNYLGVAASGLTADLIGLESILQFHAGNVNIKVNKATDTDNIAATVPPKLDWDSLTTTGMPLVSLLIDSALDVHADGSVAFNAASGVLVASGGFSLELGQVSTAAPSNGVSFTNASAVSLSLTNATVFVGAGGSLSAATSTADVVNGNLGFRGTVASLKVVSIKDTNNGSLATNDDRSYLGVQIGGLTADLIGLESILVFHAGNVNVAVNKATDADNIAATVPAKLDWDSLTTTGMSLENLSIDRALDIHADGSVAMNALGGVLVASGSFSLDLGQVSTTAPSNGVSFTNASACRSA
jgi:hypothetical protein